MHSPEKSLAEMEDDVKNVDDVDYVDDVNCADDGNCVDNGKFRKHADELMKWIQSNDATKVGEFMTSRKAIGGDAEDVRASIKPALRLVRMGETYPYAIDDAMDLWEKDKSHSQEQISQAIQDEIVEFVLHPGTPAHEAVWLGSAYGTTRTSGGDVKELQMAVRARMPQLMECMCDTESEMRIKRCGMAYRMAGELFSVMFYRV